jgi:hypothetical protein
VWLSCFFGITAMPKGAQGRKRPADVLGNAVHVIEQR